MALFEKQTLLKYLKNIKKYNQIWNEEKFLTNCKTFFRFIQRQQDEKEKIQTFMEATSKFREKRKKKKQKDRALKTAVISL
jgi:predicted NUDIX family phosphoesterase